MTLPTTYVYHTRTSDNIDYNELPSLDLMVECFRLQFNLNSKYVKSWMDSSSFLDSNGIPRFLDYRIAAIQEMIEELLPCVADTQWWKAPKDISHPANTSNAKVELVDVLHFLLSAIMKDTAIDLSTQDLDEMFTAMSLHRFYDTEATRAECKQGIYRSYGLTLTRERMRTYESFAEEGKKSLHGCIRPLSKEEVEVCTESMVASVAIFDMILVLGYRYPSVKESSYALLSEFFRLCWSLNSSPLEIFSMYLAKNRLNTFRILNGYKEGTYDKIWRLSADEEQEDNAYLFSWISSMDRTFDTKEIDTFLLETYQKHLEFKHTLSQNPSL